jgi:hypothetical protein
MRSTKFHRRTCRLTTALTALAVAVGSLVGVLPRSVESHNNPSSEVHVGGPRVAHHVERDNADEEGGFVSANPSEREVAARPEHRPGVGARVKPAKSLAMRTFEGDKRVIETRSSQVARSILPQLSPLATTRLLI